MSDTYADKFSTEQRSTRRNIERKIIVRDASNAIAHYQSVYDDDITGILEDIDNQTKDCLAEIRDEIAKEQALNWKADELGYKY